VGIQWYKGLISPCFQQKLIPELLAAMLCMEYEGRRAVWGFPLGVWMKLLTNAVVLFTKFTYDSSHHAALIFVFE